MCATDDGCSAELKSSPVLRRSDREKSIGDIALTAYVPHNWLNPLLRWEGFQPRAQGVRALLPHVDEHRPVHNLNSLEALGRALGED